MSTIARLGLLSTSLALLVGCSSASDSGPCDLPNVSSKYCEDAHRMLLPAELPPARGNRVADNEDAARLGFSLFFDSNVGAGVSCATCHAPELAFVDRVSVSIGKGTGTRNSPTTFNAARLTVFFWDGRADSLWSQPLGPVENPLEMKSTRVALLHFIASRYKSEYELVFGALPDMSSWPNSGKPGDTEYDALPETTRTAIDRAFSNVGKAFEAYMRKNATSAAPLDAFLTGDSSKLSEPAQRGLDVFLKSGCQSCHSGPMLTDESFHDVGFPSLPGAAPDPARAEGVAQLRKDPFNLAGPFADGDAEGVPVVLPSPTAGDLSAFRTPSLRNVTLTFPFGHDGALRSLPDVLAVHAPDLTANDQGDLLTFLQSLNGSYPVPPWNNWPTPQ